MSGYENEIIKALERRGFQVDYFKEGSKINRSQISLCHRLVRSLVNEYKISFLKITLKRWELKIYKSYVDKLSNSYDHIFDFGGKASESCLEVLKKKYISDYVLYLWDDLKHANAEAGFLKYFDRKYIFNESAAKSNGFIYRANFFADDFLYSNEEKTIDLFYKGTARDKSRAKILDCMSNILRDYNLELSLFVKGGWIRNLSKVGKKSFFDKWCNSEYLSLGQLAEKYKKSRVLLDIAFKGQEGLGLRPVEALASRCKIITTNENITQYCFYNSNNIFILEHDFSNAQKIPDFMGIPFEAPSQDLINYFSLDAFVEKISVLVI